MMHARKLLCVDSATLRLCGLSTFRGRWLALVLLIPALAFAQSDPTSREWNRPVKPYRVIGNIYYVGAAEVSSYLITTPQGHILLDSGFAETVPLIRENLAKLGFNLSDIKILIKSHAHFDHCGGLAELKELTGAKLAASEADAELLARGGKGDFQWEDKFAYRPVTVDRTLRDNDTIELGGVVMTARLTPGHTKGCTTWTMKVKDGGRELDVVFVGSASIPGYKLVDNEKYPNIAEDYAHTFEVLKELKCDVFLAPHGSFFRMKEKMARAEKGGANPFIDPQSYRNYVARAEKTYRDQLQKEKQAKGSR
ncbi:MAG TPA: subclass B3 metallo-beta-lactamase [Blastocatellia bacterium]